MRHLRRLGTASRRGALRRRRAGRAPAHPLARGAGPVRRALLAVLLWSSWSALWLGRFLVVIVELATLLAPSLAIQRGLSVPLWGWLAFATCCFVAVIAWWNRSLTRDYLLAAERDALASAGEVTALVAILLAATAASKRMQRRVGRWSLVVAALAPLGAWLAWLDVPNRPAVTSAAPVVLAALRTGSCSCLEGADLPWLLPAIDAGDMPFLRTRRDNRRLGAVADVAPALAPRRARHPRDRLVGEPADAVRAAAERTVGCRAPTGREGGELGVARVRRNVRNCPQAPVSRRVRRNGMSPASIAGSSHGRSAPSQTTSRSRCAGRASTTGAADVTAGGSARRATPATRRARQRGNERATSGRPGVASASRRPSPRAGIATSAVTSPALARASRSAASR